MIETVTKQNMPKPLMMFSKLLRNFSESSGWIPIKGFAFPLLIPTTLTIYSLVSMHTRVRFSGYLDHILFVLVFSLVYGFILSAPKFLWRLVLTFSLVLATALFYLFVNLNFRFFNSWGQMDALKQWEDIFAIWSGIISLMTPGDIIFGLLTPLCLWQISLTQPATSFRKFRRSLLFLGIALFLGHYKLTEKSNGYAEQNPLFFVIRQKLFQMQLTYGGYFSGRNDFLTFQRSDFIQYSPSLYMPGKDPYFPFLKIPVAAPPPLPFAFTSKPNVVLILMESVRAFESGTYGGTPSFTPNIDRLAREGILFKNFYANGAQTIRAEFAIHASYVPNMRGGQVFIDQPELAVKTLGMVLKDQGYSTHWIGSHPPTFDNKIKFHSNHGIDSFHYKFTPRYPPIGMGAADLDLVDYALDVLLQQKSPYFAEIMTLSNHYPFASYPTDSQAPAAHGSEMYQKYCRGIYYTDAAVGDFFNKVRANRAFDNTVFIITGDHGVWVFPEDPRFDGMVLRQEAFFRSPLVFWSPDHLKPQRVNVLGSQIDITPTLLDLLNIRLPNAFIGSSLFRNDIPDRYVLMNHDNRWNLRWGNDYAYDTGPEYFLSHYPLGSTLDMEKFLKNERIDHLFFHSKIDLFQSFKKGDFELLDQTRRTYLEAFAEEAQEAFDRTLLTNRIYPPHLIGK